MSTLDLGSSPDTWTLVKVDSQRWKIVAGEDEYGREQWAPMPRCLLHPQLRQNMEISAKAAPRKIAQEALDAYRRGEWPPCYRITGSGALERCDAATAEPGGGT